MSCVNFCPAAAIDKLQSANGATLIVSAQDNPAENAITHDSGYSKGRAFALLFELKWRLFFLKSEGNRHAANPRQQRRTIFKAKRDDALEIGGRKWPDSRLSASGNLAFLVQDAALNGAIRVVKLYWIGKVEIALWLDQSQKHSGRLRDRE